MSQNNIEDILTIVKPPTEVNKLRNVIIMYKSEHKANNSEKQTSLEWRTLLSVWWNGLLMYINMKHYSIMAKSINITSDKSAIKWHHNDRNVDIDLFLIRTI